MELGAGFAGDYSAAKQFAELARLGLEFAEVPLGATGDGDLEAEHLQLADTYGLPIRSAVIADFVKLPELEARAIEALVVGLHAQIACAHRLGCEVLLLPVTLPPGEPERAARYGTALAELAGTATRAALSIGVEFVGGTAPAPAAALVEQVGHPAVKLYFDVGNCMYAGVDPVASLSEHLPLVAQVHLKGGPETPLAAMALGRLRSVLDEGGFGGRCCIEVEPPKGRSALRDAVAALRMHGFWDG